MKPQPMYKFQKVNAHPLWVFFENVLDTINLYGTPMNLKVQKKNQYRSSIGLFASIIVLSISGVVFVRDLVNALQRNQPFVVTQQMIEPSPPNFSISIVLTDMQNRGIDGYGSIFNLTFRHCVRSRIRQDNGTYTVSNQCNIVPTQKCDYNTSYVSQAQKNYFQQYSFGRLLCMNTTYLQQNPPVLIPKNRTSLEGYISDTIYQYMIIQVSICNPNNSQCANTSEINRILQQGYYAAYISNLLIDDTNPFEPLQEVIQLFYTTFSKDFTKTVVSEFDPIIVQTDVGMITSQVIQNIGMQQGATNEFADQPNPNYFLYHVLQMSNRQTVKVRTYQKFQNIVGNIGGLWSVLYYLMFLIVNPLITYMMNFQITNQIFSFEPKAVGQNQSGKRKSETFVDIHHLKQRKKLSQIRHMTSNRDLKAKTPSNQAQEALKYTETVKQFLEDKKKGLQLGTLDLIRILIGRKNVQKAQLEYSMDKLVQKLDSFFLIKKLYEIEKLKQILLNENQMKLFNYMPKPCVPRSLFSTSLEGSITDIMNYENLPQYRAFLQDEKTQVRKLEDALEAYSEIKPLENKSHIDDNLIKMMDPDIRELFEIIHTEERKQLETQVSSPRRFLSRSPRNQDHNKILSFSLFTQNLSDGIKEQEQQEINPNEEQNVVSGERSPEQHD